MFRHNLKFIFRSMLANKLYAAVILLSLATAFTCAGLFLSFLVAENSTDVFHRHADRTFQVTTTDLFDDSKTMAYVVEPFTSFVNQFPVVETTCQVRAFPNTELVTGSKRSQIPVAVGADPTFFEMFDFPLTGTKVFNKNNVVISTQKAVEIFGNESPIGKTLTYDNGDTTVVVEVSAVVDNGNVSSHLRFDAVFHRDLLPGFFGGVTYIRLNPSADAVALAGKINTNAERPSIVGPAAVTYFLIPLRDAYFNTDNKFPFAKTRSRAFLTVGYVACGLVLFIAAFNVINLFVLFWHKRERGIGIRKTFGISRFAMFRFSFSETVVYVMMALPLALAFIIMMIPEFNSTFGGSATVTSLLNHKVIGAMAAIVLLTLAGMSALIVSKALALKPVMQLRAVRSSSTRTGVLFTIQFFVSIGLVICSVTLERQVVYLEEAPLGFNRSVLQINSPSEEGKPLMTALKQEVLQLPGVANAVVGNGNPISYHWIARYELEDKRIYTPTLLEGDEDFFATLGLQLKEGEMPSASRHGKVVNETLVRQFQLDNPVGKSVPGRKDEEIIGVVRDFTCGSFKNEIPPVIISYSEKGGVLLVDYSAATSGLASLVGSIESAWKGVFPGEQFSYILIQDELMKKYREDTALLRMVVSMALITMLLSCFGLFAMSWAVTRSRSREISIRRVLGATAGDVVMLLTAAFTRRIGGAFIVAAVVSYYVMDQWLSTFANRITIDAWIFISALFLVVAIAAVTLSVQVVKATSANVVDEMKVE